MWGRRQGDVVGEEGMREGWRQQVWLRVCEEGRKTSRVVHDLISEANFHQDFHFLVLKIQEIIK